MSSNECGPKLEFSWRIISRRSQLYIFSVSPFFTLHENVRFGSKADVPIVRGYPASVYLQTNLDQSWNLTRNLSINLFLPLGRHNHFQFVQDFFPGQHTLPLQHVYHGF